MTLEVMVVLGTRPEIIKFCPIIKMLEECGHNVIFVHTGQHYSSNMNDIFFKDLNLRMPDYNLQSGSGSHAEQTAKIIVPLEKLMLELSPDYVMVQGDTNSAFAGALTAAKIGIPVAHIEAGLRSDDWRMPEEFNRIMIDHISAINFAPTRTAERVLKGESVKGVVAVVGNTIIDVVEKMANVVGKPEWLKTLDIDEYVLMTYHRAENLESTEKLREVITELSKLPKKIVFSIHPRTENMLLHGGFEVPHNILLTEPKGYRDFISLLKHCEYVITDSGGIQEEVTAPSIQKKAYVLRLSTERTEAVKTKHVVLLGENPDIYVNMINADRIKEEVFGFCPYGDGTAALQIVETLEKSNGWLRKW